MRIVCPNCGAQYEVDDALIPDAGRDVQCSNCGKAWFQDKSGGATAAETEEPRPTAAEEVSEPEAPAPGVEALQEEAAPVESGEPALIDEDTFEDAGEPAVPGEEPPLPSPPDEEDEEPQGLPPGAPPPPQTDDAVLKVLREEAEREMAARRAETSSGLETQPDLGLDERQDVPKAAGAAAAVAASARRDLLPDIDEINSSLRSEAEREAEGGAQHPEEILGERRRGFRFGFALILILVMALIVLYLYASIIAAAVPALEPVLAAYVSMANALRDWIDGLLASGVDSVSGN